MLSEVISVKDAKSEPSLSENSQHTSDHNIPNAVNQSAISRKSSLAPSTYEPLSTTTSRMRESEAATSTTNHTSLRSLNDGIELEVPTIGIGESVRPSIGMDGDTQASPSMNSTADDILISDNGSEKGMSEFLTPDEAASEASDGDHHLASELSVGVQSDQQQQQQLSPLPSTIVSDEDNNSNNSNSSSNNKKLTIPKKARHLRALSMPVSAWQYGRGWKVSWKSWTTASMNPRKKKKKVLHHLLQMYPPR
ncbi:hypothetical protein BDR26DRAFT_497448 [Obelidium mucronatum]|nr:hypothetical protein BDR26DRAFT_497448 [Obelidium mucronatum]